MAAFGCLRTAQTKRRRPEVEYLVDMGADIAAVDNTEELAAFHRSSLATPGDVASSDLPLQETALDLALARHGEKPGSQQRSHLWLKMLRLHGFT